MKDIKHIHFVGIKGVGMTALAIIAKEAGIQVTGSDIGEQYITDSTLQQAGINPFIGFSAEHVADAQLIVTTGAHSGFDNIEVKSAKEKGIQIVSMAEAVGMLMSGRLFGRKFKGISVAGTHGKTTTTAMIATILKENKLDPAYFIGTSYIPSLGVAGHYGTGEYFVVEADEYATEPVYDKRPKFYWHNPKIAIITSIEHDHPDIYPDLQSVQKVFRNFLLSLSPESVAIINGDDREIQKILLDYTGRKITYGLDEHNDAILHHIQLSGSGQLQTVFQLKVFGSELGEFVINVAGEHNAQNAVAAILAGLEAGLDIENIKSGLKKFIGSKRRLEFKGKTKTGALLYDDYGHHPTEIRKTLTALRTIYPEKRIITIFQPHTFSRTKTLFTEFAGSFLHADTVIFLDIFGSAREKDDPSVSSRMLAEEVYKKQRDVHYLANIPNVVQYLDTKKPGDDTIVITMGAGDVYKVSERIREIRY